MTLAFDISSFRSSGEAFFQTLLKESQEAGLPNLDYVVDHLCFRTETLEQYEFYKSALSKQGTLLTENPVNGRPIATFRLLAPFKVGSHSIHLVELPAPKAGSNYKLGFEHAEIVINESFESFRSKFPHGSKLDIAGNKVTNPELCFKLPSGQVKFHYLSLDRIIEIEQAKITDVIFDFDGTIIHSREEIYEINRRVFAEALERPVSLQEAKDKFHTEFSMLFQAFEVTCPVKQKRAVNAWGEVAEEYTCSLFEGVTDLLKSLKENGLRLHLWTARDEPSARRILSAHHLTDFFDTLSFATVKDSKPHASSLTFNWKSASTNSVALIGDSSTDMRGAKNTGCIAAAALWDPYVQPDSLIASGAELYFSRPEEFSRWIFSLAQD